MTIPKMLLILLRDEMEKLREHELKLFQMCQTFTGRQQQEYSYQNIAQNATPLSTPLTKIIYNLLQLLLIRGFKIVCMYCSQCFNHLAARSLFLPHYLCQADTLFMILIKGKVQVTEEVVLSYC